MFLRLQMVNWGPFRAHALGLEAPIIDFCGENGTAKTTILDAHCLAIGIDTVAGDRGPAHYQRDKNPCFVALTLQNPTKASGRRFFVGLEATFTVLARFDHADDPQRRFLIFPSGDVDIREAITVAGRPGTKWLKPKEYNQRWEAAGFPAKDRVNRTFSHQRPTRIRNSDPRTLYTLFETFASDPEISSNLSQARRDYDKTDGDVAAALRGHEVQRTELMVLENDIKEGERFAKETVELVRQERLVKIARHLRAQEELRKHNERQSGDAQRRTALQEERRVLVASLPTLKKTLSIESLQRDGFQGQFDDADNRLRGIQQKLVQAEAQAEIVKAEREELNRLKDLDPTPDITAELEQVHQNQSELAKQAARLENDQRALELRRRALTTDGVPLQVLAAIEDLQETKIAFTEARSFLPKSEPQVYEDALGPLRYGLLVRDAATQARVVEIVTRHRYPGPISILSPAEYEKKVSAGWKRSTDGFVTELGVFVAQDFDPVLNRKLAEQVAKTIDKQLTSVAADQKKNAAANQGLSKKRADLQAILGPAQRRDALEVKSKKWPEILATCEDNRKEHKLRKEHYDELHGTLQGAKTRTTNAADALRATEDRIAAIDQDLRPFPQIENSLEKDVVSSFEECKDFLEELRGEARSVTHHEQNVADLAKGLKEIKKPWTPELLVQTRTKRDKLLEQRAKDAIRVEEKTTNMKTAKATLERLEDDQKNAIRKEFNSAKKRIETLAPNLGFAAKLDLKFDPEGRPVLHYLVKFGHEHWTAISSEELSTGEGGIAAYTFCLGLSSPDQRGWYCLDEPSQNFGYGNTDNLFRILGTTNAQVIITSPKDQDYSDDIDVLRYYLGEIGKDQRAPQPTYARVKAGAVVR